MIINNNISALNTYRQLGVNNAAGAKAMEKLSSGLRINRAGDDAAGLAISEKMRAQVRGLDQASRNAQDGISMIQTAEGALQETQNILQRMRELATQASNDTNVGIDREEIQKEINQLTSEINRIGNTTEFNTKTLLEGKGGSLPETSGTTLANGTGDATTGTAAAGSITFDKDELVAVGTTIKIGDQTYEIYNSDDSSAPTGGNVGIDIKGFTSNEEVIDEIVANAPTNVTVVKDGTNDNVLNVTATATGVAGNDIELTVTPTEDKFSATFQIGANKGQSMTIEINDMRAKSLGISSTDATAVGYTDGATVSNGTNNTSVERALDVSTHESASAAIKTINDAIESVSAERSNLGAFQNRLEHTISNLGTSSENLQAAESRIRDVDMAKEVMEMTRTNILSQASQAMLAQANQKPQAVLQLLG